MRSASARRIQAPRHRAPRAPACARRPRHGRGSPPWLAQASASSSSPKPRSAAPLSTSSSAWIALTAERGNTGRSRRRARARSHRRHPPPRPRRDGGSRPSRRARLRPEPDYSFVMSADAPPCHSSGGNHLYSIFMFVARPRLPAAVPAAKHSVGLSPGICSCCPCSARAARSPIAAARRTGASGTGRASAACRPRATHPEARILVMSGRTRGWKGALAVHSWIVIKRENDAQLEPLRRCRLGQSGALNWWPPDLWFGEHADGARRHQGRAGRGADPADRSRDQGLSATPMRATT